MGHCAGNSYCRWNHSHQRLAPILFYHAQYNDNCGTPHYTATEAEPKRAASTPAQNSKQEIRNVSKTVRTRWHHHCCVTGV